MKPLKSEKHHWWPRCVSIHWRAADGTVARVDPTGRIVRSTPEKFGSLKTAITSNWTTPITVRLFGTRVSKGSLTKQMEPFLHLSNGSWDCLILTTLRMVALPNKHRTIIKLRRSRRVWFRSWYGVRETGKRQSALPNTLGGPLPTKERNALIAMNMHRKQRMIADSIGHHGKFAVLFSRDKEFIFGDGFFHNLNAVANPPYAPKILVPLTPSMAIAITRPMSYRTEPRLVSLVLNDAEVASINRSIQIYSKSELFFRSEKPRLEEAFRAEKHAEFSHPDNPIDTLLRSLPGVPDRDRRLDGMFGV